MSAPAEVLGQIIGWLDEEHLSCLLRASWPMYRAVQRVQLAVPVSYAEGRLHPQAKAQQARTAASLLERQRLDWKDCLELRRGVYVPPRERRGLIGEYAHGLGQRYRHVCVYLDEPGLGDIAAGLATSTGWRHLEVMACASAARQLAPFLDAIVAGLRSIGSPEPRELSLYMGADMPPALLQQVASSLLPLLADGAPVIVSGMRISAAMIGPLAMFIKANPHLQRLALDLQDGMQSASALSLLEHCSAQPGGLLLQNVPAWMDYRRLAAALRARPAMKSLCLYGRAVHREAGGLVLAEHLAPRSLSKLGLAVLQLGARSLDGLAGALAEQAGLHTLKFRACSFPDGIAPLIEGLAANRSIVRLALIDCAIRGDAGDGGMQREVLRALRCNPAIRQIKIDSPDNADLRREVAELRRHCAGLQVIRYDAKRGDGGASIQDE